MNSRPGLELSVCFCFFTKIILILTVDISMRKIILEVEYCMKYDLLNGEQGWRSGESTRVPPMWPGFKSRRRRHMWVVFVVGSLPHSERFFSGYSGFPLPSKTNTSKFQSDLERTETFKRVLKNS